MWGIWASLLSLCAAAGTVVFVQEVCRHGARSPSSYYLPWDSDGRWTVAPGDLTTSGMRMHFLLGSELRQRYILSNSHLVDSSYNASQVFVRATAIDRTMVSAQSQLWGLFPPSTGPGLATTMDTVAVPPISVNKVDNIVQDISGKALPQLFQTFPVIMYPFVDDWVSLAQAPCPLLLNRTVSPEISEIYAKMSLSNPWLLTALNETLHFSTTEELANAVTDVMESYYCNMAMSYPFPDFSEELIANATIIINEVFSYVYRSDENARLFSSWFFQDLLESLDALLNNRTLANLRIYSAHDVTVAGLLAGLQVFDYAQPPFASTLIFEVSLDNYQYFVRVIYNDKPLIIPLCEEILCPIETFMTYLKIRSYGSTDVCFSESTPWSSDEPSSSGSDWRPGKGESSLKVVAWVTVALCALAAIIVLGACVFACRSRRYDLMTVDDFSSSAIEKRKVINMV